MRDMKTKQNGGKTTIDDETKMADKQRGEDDNEEPESWKYCLDDMFNKDEIQKYSYNCT